MRRDGRRGAGAERRRGGGARPAASAPRRGGTPGSGTAASGRAAEAGRRLLRWFRRAKRDLPWRGTRDPYRIWVSEVMLQQTRVAVVLPHYERFLERFPTVRELAAAGEDQVLSSWSGLGYYGRARQLHRAAREICARPGGAFPRAEREARALPGVGPYTAAAVLSIAHGARLPVLDGNAVRVLSRLFGERGDAGRAEVRARLLRLAGEVMGRRPPGGMNQAVMELGALLCSPRAPSCGECPLAGGLCAAEEQGLQEELPRKAPRAPRRTVLFAAALLGRRGKLLLVREARGGFVRGMWQPPAAETEEGEGAEAALRRALRRLGVAAGPLRRAGEVRHAILNRDLRVEAWRGAPRSVRSAGAPRGTQIGWFAPEEAERLPLSSLARKLLRLAGSRPAAPHGAPSISRKRA